MFPVELPLDEDERIDLQKCVLNSSWFSLDLLKAVFTTCAMLIATHGWWSRGYEFSTAEWQRLHRLLSGHDINRYFARYWRGQKLRTNVFTGFKEDVVDRPTLEVYRMGFVFCAAEHGYARSCLHPMLCIEHIPDWLLEGPFTKRNLELFIFLRQALEGTDDLHKVEASDEILYRGIRNAIASFDEFSLRMLLEFDAFQTKLHPAHGGRSIPLDCFHAAAAFDEPDMLRALVDMDARASLPAEDEALETWIRRANEREERYGEVLSAEMAAIKKDVYRVSYSKAYTRHDWAVYTFLGKRRTISW